MMILSGNLSITAQPVSADPLSRGEHPEVYPGRESPDSNAAPSEDYQLILGKSGESSGPVYDHSGAVRSGTKPAGDNGQTEDEKQAADPGKRKMDGSVLSEEEAKVVRELKVIDRKVRAHEMAHVAAGGSLVRGGPNYQYRKGPDGNTYAVGGEVSIDTSEEKTPEMTVQKMQRVQAAALAPADPSSQDRAVAATAAEKALFARIEMMQESQTENSSPPPDSVEGERSTEKSEQHRSSYEKASAQEEEKSSFSITA